MLLHISNSLTYCTLSRDVKSSCRIILSLKEEISHCTKAVYVDIDDISQISYFHKSKKQCTFFYCSFHALCKHLLHINSGFFPFCKVSRDPYF